MPRLPKLGFGDINDGSTEGYGIKRDRARFDFPLIGQSQPHRTPKSPGCSGAVASTWPSKRRGVGASRPQTGIRKRNAWRSFRAVTGEGGLEISRPSGRKRRRTGRRRYGIRSARSEGSHLEYPEYSSRGYERRQILKFRGRPPADRFAVSGSQPNPWESGREERRQVAP